MTSVRTAIRAAAVLGATAALTVAGAGAASAATVSSPLVEGNTISVTFEKEGSLDVATCVAAVAPAAEAAAFATKLAAISNLDLGAITELLSGDTVATFLRGPGNLPVVNVTLGNATVSATVEPDAYSLVTYCVPGEPEITPLVLVGDPIEVILGSLGGFSSGAGEGDETGDGIDIATLSSALGGGDTDGGLDLGTLSSQADAGAEN